MTDNNEINRVRKKKVSSKSNNNSPIDLNQRRRQKNNSDISNSSLSKRIEMRNEELRRNRRLDLRDRDAASTYTPQNDRSSSAFPDERKSNLNKIRIKKLQSSGSDFRSRDRKMIRDFDDREDDFYEEEPRKSRFSLKNIFNLRKNNRDDEYCDEDMYDDDYNDYKPRRRVFSILRKIALVCLVLFLVLVSAGFLYFRSVVADMPELTKRSVRESYINKDPVPIKRIPKDLQNAVISIEDERFYKHGGVDYRSMLRSLLTNIRYGPSQGGSTIDMQVSKNLLTSNERSIKRKVQDMYNAYRLNKIMTKDEILEAYLNNIYLGKSAYGVQAGAELYFGKNVWELSFGQSTMLAGITNNPALYQDYEQAKKRQALVVGKMYKLGYIKENVYKAQLYRDTPFKSEIDK